MLKKMWNCTNSQAASVSATALRMLDPFPQRLASTLLHPRIYHSMSLVIPLL